MLFVKALLRTGSHNQKLLSKMTQSEFISVCLIYHANKKNSKEKYKNFQKVPSKIRKKSSRIQFLVFFKNYNPACIGQAHAVNEGIGSIRVSVIFLV